MIADELKQQYLTAKGIFPKHHDLFKVEYKPDGRIRVERTDINRVEFFVSISHFETKLGVNQ